MMVMSRDNKERRSCHPTYTNSLPTCKCQARSKSKHDKETKLHCGVSVRRANKGGVKKQSADGGSFSSSASSESVHLDAMSGKPAAIVGYLHKAPKDKGAFKVSARSAAVSD